MTVLLAAFSGAPAFGRHSTKSVAGTASFQAGSSMLPSIFREAVVRFAGSAFAVDCCATTGKVNAERSRKRIARIDCSLGQVAFTKLDAPNRGFVTAYQKQPAGKLN